MFRTWRRPTLVQTSRRLVASLSSAVFARRPFPPSSTTSRNRLTILFYSSIISTAAAADVRVKQTRRRQWDVAIAEVEEFLCKNPTQSQPLPPSQVSDGETQGRVNSAYNNGNSVAQGHTGISPPTRNPPQQLEFISPKETRPTGIHPRHLEARYISDRLRKKLDITHSLKEKLQSKSRVSHSSIYAPAARRKSRAAPWGPKKHIRVEYSVAKLASRLVTEALSKGPDNVEQTRMLNKTLQNISHRLERIQTADAFNLYDLERLHYPQYKMSLATTDEDLQLKLSNTLASVIRRYAEGRYSYKSTLQKIAYNFLTSPVPPNTATYALLISRFNRLQCPQLVSMFIDSMLESCIRHNEISVTAILQHYLQIRDYRKFHAFVCKLQGLGRGLMLAKPNVRINGVGSLRLREQNGKVVQAMTIDGQMAFTIIRGYLSFNDKDHAMKWFDKTKRLGIEPDIKILCSLLRYYALRSMWEPGKVVWDEIYSQFFGPSGSNDSSPADEALAFHHALQLCRLCGASKEFRAIYKEGLSRGISITKLLWSPVTRRGFTIEDDLAEKRKRAIQILERRVELLIEDNRNWALHLLASKMLLSGLKLADLEAMFHRFQQGSSYFRWFRSRPWLWKRKWHWIASSGEAREKPFEITLLKDGKFTVPNQPTSQLVAPATNMSICRPLLAERSQEFPATVELETLHSSLASPA